VPTAKPLSPLPPQVSVQQEEDDNLIALVEADFQDSVKNTLESLVESTRYMIFFYFSDLFYILFNIMRGWRPTSRIASRTRWRASWRAQGTVTKPPNQRAS
jgi:hypothetical protein